jgi:hypothetical protein
MKAEVSRRSPISTYWGKVQSKLWSPIALMSCLAGMNLHAATTTIYSENFDSYSGAATNLTDTANANPGSPDIIYPDDNPAGGVNGSGVQLINWLSHSGSNALLVRSGSEAQVLLKRPLSGTKYTLDFWMYVVKGTGTKNFILILRGMGADSNGDDYLAYRSDRAATANTYYYDGIGPSAANWIATGGQHLEAQWQHHRLVVDTAAQKFNLFVDDMVNPVVAGGDLARPDVAVPTLLRIQNEGTVVGDGYFVIDDLTMTVDDAKDLTTTFTEGFEGYPARSDVADDTDPLGPWNTLEVAGTGAGKSLDPTKVQVVGTDVVTPHSGSKCLKLEAGQRAGVSFAWGQAPQSDVQITWWARVPASVPGTTATWLRMSLYGNEDGNPYSGDAALLGYGSRDATTGDDTSLTYYTTTWRDSGADYTPDTWEEYRLTTSTAQGTYTIVKNPSSANPVVVVDRAPFVGSATKWGPMFMAAWSSSNGSAGVNNPPVYIDDIEIKALTVNPNPLPAPYSVALNGNRFTNVTVLTLGGSIGSVAVDPRDKTSIIYTLDAASNGGIYRAPKVASGNWAAEPTATATPIVTGLASPSGLAIEPGNGNIWWTHDFTTALMRLKFPWTSNVPEQIIADFVGPTNNPAAGAWLDDDTCDVVFPPATFNGSLGNSSQLVVMDRGVDYNLNNAFFLVDPGTTTLMQTNYDRYLYGPSTSSMGWLNLAGMTTLPQSGEIVSLNQDAQVTAVNGDGVARVFWPNFYADPTVSITPATIATDPNTGRIWIGDDLWDQLWSCAPDGTAEQLELSFPLTDTTRPDRQLTMHSPGGGMVFSPDGKFMVMSDNSIVNGGGRLLIFHNESFAVPSFTVTNVTSAGQQVQLSWSSAGAVRYSVQRATSLTGTGSFQTIGTNLTSRQFSTTNVVGGTSFYRVLASPSNTP